LISLAKRFETVYHAKTGKALLLPRDSSALHLLQKVRDEAHRFAITYHRYLKEKALKISVLDQIPGIGEKRKQLLRQQFDSLDELKRTGMEQLAGLPGMGPAAAKRIWEYFHRG